MKKYEYTSRQRDRQMLSRRKHFLVSALTQQHLAICSNISSLSLPLSMLICLMCLFLIMWHQLPLRRESAAVCDSLTAQLGAVVAISPWNILAWIFRDQVSHCSRVIISSTSTPHHLTYLYCCTWNHLKPSVDCHCRCHCFHCCMSSLTTSLKQWRDFRV